jgi:hypothetical protein
MTSQPEKLFHDKLENFQRPAPAAAWERIEAGLDKTSNKKLWMKIAAGILLLTVAGFVLWPAQSEQTETLAKKNPATEQKKAEKTSPAEITQPVVAEKYVAEKKATSKIKSEAKKEITKQEPVLVAEQSEIQPEKNFVIEPIETTQVAVVEEKESTSKTIVYTADEVNARFLKKNISVEATGEDKKPSGIQKLMGLAYDLKTNENGMRDLRQKKDEILALNFLNNNEDKTEKSKN